MRFAFSLLFAGVMYVAFSLTPCPGLNLNPTTTCYHVLVESRPTHFTFFFKVHLQCVGRVIYYLPYQSALPSEKQKVVGCFDLLMSVTPYYGVVM